MTFVKKINRDIVMLFIMMFFSMALVHVWFRGDLLISYGDFAFLPDGMHKLFNQFYIWNDYSLGKPNPRTIPTIFPYVFYRLFAEYIGCPIVVEEKFLFFLWLLFSMMSMYFLIRTLLGRTKRIAGVGAAIFYTLNLYTAVFIWSQPTTLIFTYIFLPLKLALFVKSLNSRDAKYIFSLAIIWIFSNAAYANPVYSIIDWALLVLYLIFFTIFKKSFYGIRLAGVLVFLWFLLNINWILPLLPFIEQEYLAATIGAGRNALLTFKLDSAQNMIEPFRLGGWWAFWSGYKGDLYYPWSHIDKNPLFSILSFFPPFISFSSLILLRRFDNKKKENVLFFSLLALLSLFLMKGANSFGGEFISWLFLETSLINVFSHPVQIFGIYVSLAYAFLIGNFLDLLAGFLFPLKNRFNLDFDRSNLYRKIIAIIIVILLVCSWVVYAYPFWSGEIIHGAGNVLPSARIRIPLYYFSAENWISAKKNDFRIFSIPMNVLTYGSYWWNNGSQGYWASDPTPSLFSSSVITLGYDTGTPGYNLGYYIATRVTNNSCLNIAKTLSILNVKYILLHRDVNVKFIEGDPWWISTTPERYEQILDSQKGIHLEKSFDKLDFYRNEYWKPMHIYATPNALLFDGGLDEMIQVVEREDFTPGESVLFLTDQLEAQQISALPPYNSLNTNSTNDVSLTYEKINPTQYVVHVNASKPFFLVFSESYHKDWIAYVDGQKIPNEQHYMANGFANSWYVNKTGSFTITLEFWPQKLFYTGAAISITTLILCILYISKDKIKTAYRKYIKKKPNISEDLKTKQKEILSL